MKIIMIMIALSVVVVWAHEPQNSNPSKQYCEMTQIYADSGGEYGWPDDKNIAEDC